jgi:hypothetical protein
VLHSDHSATKTDHHIYSHCVLKIMLNTTNQSINLPDALIEICFGQFLFMCNLVRLFSWTIHNHAMLFQKTNPHENKLICPLKTWSWNHNRETSYTVTTRAYLMWYSLSVTRRRTIFYSGLPPLVKPTVIYTCSHCMLKMKHHKSTTARSLQGRTNSYGNKY